ncbi:hypothetical protein GQ53DRAFT_669369 [Thozetella sp. PMI_491]|nr:hypothetical protein GQ53DRAFT_669369 [Thozetella sp. PMI_491]
MADSAAAAASGTVLEALRHQSSQSRRARPPVLSMNGGDEVRVPLRVDTERLNRRESKLGLRNIFGRHKDKSSVDTESAGPSPRDSHLIPGRIRASLAELSSNWPYGSQASRSELSLSSPPIAQSLRHKKSASTVRGQPLLPKSSRGSLATWDPPPLFQAYPQAIRHAHLPACTLPAEAILRLQSGKGTVSIRDGINHSSMTLDAIDETSMDKDKSKRKHKRNLSGSAFDWTTKIFVLVTSGYLLQYAGEGSFDRLPEKMLQIGKDSAAFASDVIPGRHWVLQVSSATDAEGVASTHQSSLFSRLPFRGPERRHCSNFLMVFESADEMDNWIATLRREIESMGGKKNLSETGVPKVDDHLLQLKSQTSQRTLVVRDPDRFSRILTPDVHWEQGGPVQSPEIHLDSVDDFRDQSFDETSSASGYSHDGRQLEGLRDSANRLSFISSGQRTMVTSAGSSPACSPVRDSFASTVDDLTLTEPPRDHLRPRPRPNAAVINDRRQSMQTMNHVELRVASAAMPRPHSTTYSSSWQPESTLAMSNPLATTPNFSVPNGAGKRYSLAKSPSMDSGTLNSSPPQPRSQPFKSMRRPPPTALAINPRPLSFVEDQPSPLSPPIPQQGHQQLSEHTSSVSTAPDSPSMFSKWTPPVEQSTALEVPVLELPLRESSLPVSQTTRSISQPNRRRGSSFGSSRRSVHGSRLSLVDQQPARSATQSSRRSRAGSDIGLGIPQFDPKDLPLRARTPSLKPPPRPVSSVQHLRVDTFNRVILQRKSMSQLTTDVGPPPAPPPTCALPPIPVKMTEGSREGIPI